MRHYRRGCGAGEFVDRPNRFIAHAERMASGLAAMSKTGRCREPVTQGSHLACR